MSELTEEQAESLVRELAKENSNVQSFFTDVIHSKDTTKTGNLNEEELGVPIVPVRSVKELELFSKEVWHNTTWGDYFHKLSEIHTATSLSKNATLIKLAVTKKSEVADLTQKPVKENKGWFKSRKNN